MKNEEVDRMRHSQNVEVMKRGKDDMMRTNRITQEVVDQRKDMVETENFIWHFRLCPMIPNSMRMVCNGFGSVQKNAPPILPP